MCVCVFLCTHPHPPFIGRCQILCRDVVRSVRYLEQIQSVNRLLNVTRHFADQVLKNNFSSWTHLNELLDAVCNTDYESDIYFVKKSDFAIENQALKFQKSYFEFFNQEFFQKMLKYIQFDAEFHSLQNGLFSYDFRSYRQLVDSYTVFNLMPSL